MSSGRTPPQRPLHRPSILVWLGVVAASIVPPIQRLSSGKGGGMDWMMLSAATIGITYVLVDGFRWRRRVRDLIKTEWRRCPRCFFDLRGLPERGKCPECGDGYILSSVHAWWRAVISGESPPSRRDDH